MKRTLILLLAICLVGSFPATAEAGKPEPATVEVSITGDIATTCTGEITMNYDDRRNHKIEGWVGDLSQTCVYLMLEDLEPGCYCGHHQDNEDPDAYAGIFRLVEQPDGTVELISQFDRLWVITYRKNGKQGSTLNSAYSLQGVLEGDFNWALDSGGGILTGDLVLQHFFKEVGSAGGTWTEISTTPVTITVAWHP